jgi:pimeloyl-ACP methyl ester carboxylesterase
LAKAGRIRVPTTVVHGDADEIVPFWMGERIARSITGARLVRVRGGHHGDLFEHGTQQWLSEALGPSEGS